MTAGLKLFLLLLYCALHAATSAAELRFASGEARHDPLTCSGSYDDVIDVFYCESALFKGRFGEALYILNGFHGGLAFRNRNTGASATVEFVAKYGVDKTLFPKVNGTDLLWNDDGDVFTYNYVNNTYWDRQTFMCRTNGAVYNAFVNWVPTFSSPYELFRIRVPANGSQPEITYNSHTCVDFAWRCFRSLYDLDALIYDDPPLKRDVVYVYGSAVSVVALDDARDDIANYYKAVNGLFDKLVSHDNKTIVQLFEELFEDIANCTHIYVRKDGTDQYYRITPTSPYAGFEYVAEALPSGPKLPVNSTAGPNKCAIPAMRSFGERTCQPLAVSMLVLLAVTLALP